MAKRACVNRTERQEIDLLKVWREHPEWDSSEAARHLGVKESTLRGWKKMYGDRLDSIAGSDRKRKHERGPGPRRKTKPYEGQVIEYFDSLCEEGKCTFTGMLFYCRNIDEFVKDFPEPSGQKSWVSRFIKHYSGNKSTSGEKVCDTNSSGSGANSEGGGVNSGDCEANCDSGGANSDGVVDSDEGRGNSDEGGVNSDEGGANSDGGGANSDEGGAASDSGDSLFEIDTHETMARMPVEEEIFRKRYPKGQVVVEWSGEGKYVCLFPEDLKSLLPDQLLTENALDYFVHRYMKPTPGVLCTCGTDLYRSIELEWRSKKSAMSGDFNWAAYPYVLLIVSGVKHYSILIVENAMQNGPTGMFHINSLKGAHDSAYVFNMMRWNFEKERKKCAGLTPTGTYSAGAFNTKPQQSNCVDCGLYVLHYMEKIGIDILKLKEQSSGRVLSIKEQLEAWVSGKFTARSAAMYRNVMRQKITDAANEAKNKRMLF